MILVGELTAGTSERRLQVMQRLGSQVLDLLAGLPTLRAFGREHGPEKRVRALGDANRRATMGTLRVAFLSGMVLELLTTLSVALVAVGIGLRLVYGEVGLEPALAVLVLAPRCTCRCGRSACTSTPRPTGSPRPTRRSRCSTSRCGPSGRHPRPRSPGHGSPSRGEREGGDRDVLAPAGLTATLGSRPLGARSPLRPTLRRRARSWPCPDPVDPARRPRPWSSSGCSRPTPDASW
ncbi:ABC transporter transmembrane domain-containing protein [Oerskovia sp. M15]